MDKQEIEKRRVLRDLNVSKSGDLLKQITRIRRRSMVTDDYLMFHVLRVDSTHIHHSRGVMSLSGFFKMWYNGFFDIEVRDQWLDGSYYKLI